jgi:hypothetical protein
MRKLFFVRYDITHAASVNKVAMAGRAASSLGEIGVSRRGGESSRKVYHKSGRGPTRLN